jgi:hypothetical protein
MIRMAMVVCLILTVVIGVPLILAWWKDMDRLADAEHKKFKPKVETLKGERVVVRSVKRVENTATRDEETPPASKQRHEG